jgi:tRNA 2-thiouridine synthesizing protein A
MAGIVLDARGLMCPDPIVEAETISRDAPGGQEVLVLATDPAAPIDFEVWCIHKGHQYLGQSDKGEWLEIRLMLGSD